MESMIGAQEGQEPLHCNHHQTNSTPTPPVMVLYSHGQTKSINLYHQF
jgi:hypothetical protein